MRDFVIIERKNVYSDSETGGLLNLFNLECSNGSLGSGVDSLFQTTLK